MKGPNERLRIVVLGYIVRGPLGGLAWHHLQYVLGLRALGHDVIFLEDSDDYPSCYDPTGHTVGTDPTYGLRFTRDAFSRLDLDLADRWAYYDAHSDSWHGPLGKRARAFCSNADICLNVSGVNPVRPWLASIPCRALIDTDPVFTQIRHLTDEGARARAEEHTVFFTFGENLASGVSSCPDDGFPWKATRQPMFLDAWPVTPAPKEGCFTTVMQWDSYRPVEFNGRHYGMKSESFRQYLDLPTRVGAILELAIGSEHAPRENLENNHWRLRDPLEVTRTPWTYQDYIRRSRGEFTVAKHGYVVGNSGWFSERSAAYLGSGRPVITQDTGFSGWLPNDAGLLAFSSPAEAAGAFQSVLRDYETHCRAAREIAAEFFDSRTVLTKLVEQALNVHPTSSPGSLKDGNP